MPGDRPAVHPGQPGQSALGELLISAWRPLVSPWLDPRPTVTSSSAWRGSPTPGSTSRGRFPRGPQTGLPNQSSPLLRRPRRGAGSLSCIGADGQQADVIDGQAGMEDPGDRLGDGRNELNRNRT